MLAVLLLPLVAHGAVLACTHMAPPAVQPPGGEIEASPLDPTGRTLGRSYARMRGAIREVRLMGGAVERGYAHARLLYADEVAIEGAMHEQFARYVPLAPARWLLVDLARLRFRRLDETLAPESRREIAAQALGFAPDPFAGMMGTYQRFVFLHSLYDIMLSFERSPLVGCTSFVLGPEATAGGHTLLGRNFDFEGPQILDDRKAVFLVHGDGPIPYASVSWPGFIGSASGMNAAGLAIVVHGARAGEARPQGAPVAHTVRRLLATAHDTGEVLAQLGRSDAMVPHILLVADGNGQAAAVERVPGAPPFVRRRVGATLALTNHFEGPHADDPKNRRVRQTSSSVARKQRLDEILANLAPAATVQRAVEILRDKRAVGGAALALGSRIAIDSLIATHSIVMDLTDRALWVSEGPHAAGRYVRFDLRELLDPAYAPAGPATVEAVAADPIVGDGRYQAWLAAGATHGGAQ